MPDLLHWVHNYGPTGAVPVEQPDAIWDHRCTDAMSTSDGRWHLVLGMSERIEA